MTSPFTEHSAISKLKEVNRETLGLQFGHAFGLQFPNAFFKRSMISGGWVVTLWPTSRALRRLQDRIRNFSFTSSWNWGSVMVLLKPSRRVFNRSAGRPRAEHGSPHGICRKQYSSETPAGFQRSCIDP